MNRKDILELRRHLKNQEASFTQVSACFVDYNKDIVLRLDENFLSLEEDDYFKYLEIARKVLSGGLDNNLLELNFSRDLEKSSQSQGALIDLKKSKLKDPALLEAFYKNIIANYDYDENYLILVFHDVYDIMTKTSDGQALDESEEVFEYIICALCPVGLSKPALGYFEDENTIKSRLRDWIVDLPINGFLYPAFIDRSADVNSLIYYSKNPKDTHPELITQGLSCQYKETIKLQKDKFQKLIKDSMENKDEADAFYVEVQDRINDFLDEKSFLGPDRSSIELDLDSLENILLDTGLEKEDAHKIKTFYGENFKEQLPKGENILDKKLVEQGQQIRTEESLRKEIHQLQEELDEGSKLEENYDLILRANQDLIDQIRSEVIDGKNYILIPVEENRTKINKL